MSIDTYSGLITEINDWLSRNDVTAVADTFIDLAEERLSRDLRIRANEATMNATLSGGVATIPSDYVQLKHVHIAGTPVQPLAPKESPWIFDQFPDRTSAEKARFIAEDGANFVFGPSGKNGDVLGGAYWKKPTGLSSGNTTNEWTDNCPDALFLACMCETAPYIMNDQRILVWESKYDQAKNRIMISEKKRTRKGSRVSIDPGVSV